MTALAVLGSMGAAALLVQWMLASSGLPVRVVAALASLGVGFFGYEASFESYLLYSMSLGSGVGYMRML